MTSAGQEEQAELDVLRERAAASGRELSQTAAALAGKLAESTRPRHWASRGARRWVRRNARHWARQRARRQITRARQALRALPVRQALQALPARQVALRAWPARASRPKLAVSAGLLVIAAVAVTWQHRRHG